MGDSVWPPLNSNPHKKFVVENSRASYNTRFSGIYTALNSIHNHLFTQKPTIDLRLDRQPGQLPNVVFDVADTPQVTPTILVTHLHFHKEPFSGICSVLITPRRLTFEGLRHDLQLSPDYGTLSSTASPSSTARQFSNRTGQVL
jgi:hypothetical protein